MLWLWLGKRRVKTHRIAILATAIPSTVLLMTVVVYNVLNRGEALRKLEGFPIAYICGFVGFGLAVAAILSSVVFAIMRKWEIAKGTGFGSSIGFAIWVIALVSSFVFYYGWN